ncbi:uncharacterized protein J3D65DRAFT_605952 [Phyllosticta citribraziliensis]|uniref:Uncharacterized protein n=1 Tax=Phyllosticta citribraziliensis TaxID=989973 RepID=A0ABR1LBZ6_9PEZI
MPDRYAKRNVYKENSYVHGGSSLLPNSYVHADSSLVANSESTSREDKAMRTRLDNIYQDVKEAEHENKLITSSLVNFREQSMKAEIKELKKALHKADKRVAKFEEREEEYENHIEVLERKLEDTNKTVFAFKDKARRLQEELRREKYCAFRLQQEGRPLVVAGPGGSRGAEGAQQIHSGKYKKRDKELDRLVQEEAMRRASR